MSRPSIVIPPQAHQVGVILQKNGGLRFMLFGEGDLPAPEHHEEPFDLAKDRTFTLASAGLRSVHRAFERSAQLDDALELLQRFTEGRECHHEQVETASGVAVCTKKGCDLAAADALLVEDYATANIRKHRRSTKAVS